MATILVKNAVISCNKEVILEKFCMYKNDIAEVFPLVDDWKITFTKINSLILYLRKHSSNTVTIDGSIFWVIELIHKPLFIKDYFGPRPITLRRSKTQVLFDGPDEISVSTLSSWPELSTHEEKLVDYQNTLFRIEKLCKGPDSVISWKN